MHHYCGEDRVAFEENGYADLKKINQNVHCLSLSSSSRRWGVITEADISD